MNKVLLYFCIFISPCSLAEKLQTITLGVILFPPNVVVDPISQKCVGKNIDRTKEILMPYNIQVDVICVSAVRTYRMIENSELDLTINALGTKALTPHVTYIKKPFSEISINLYQYIDIKNIHSVAAVRGFDYAGQRQRLKQANIEFLDLPNSISAIQVFVKRRSDALISYELPFLFYSQNNSLKFKDQLKITQLETITAHYAISNNSQHFDLLYKSLNEFSAHHNRPFLAVPSKP